MQTAVILMSVATFGAAFYLLLKDRFWAGMFLSILPAVLAGMALDSGLSASSSKSQSPVLTYIYLVSAGLGLTCFSAGVTRIRKRTQPKVNAFVRRVFNQKEPKPKPLLDAIQTDPEGSWKNLSRREKIGAVLVLVVLVLAPALMVIATHSKPAQAPGVSERAALPVGKTLAADGKPTVGRFKITTAGGDVLMQDVRADGTFVSTFEGEIDATGKWEQRAPGVYCSVKDEKDATPVCNIERVDDKGVWTSKDPEGKVARIERVQA